MTVLFRSLIVMLLIVPGLVSAVGLSFTEEIYIINKTAGEDLQVSLTIVNEESFTFYDIRLENENIIDIPPIGQLDPGQNVTINAVINSNNNF